MQEGLNYTIDERDPHSGGIILILARIENFGMEVAAYHQAILNWANVHIVLWRTAWEIQGHGA